MEDVELEVGSPSPKRRRTLTSESWQYYTRNGNKVQCNFCETSYGGKVSTSTMKNHTQKFHSERITERNSDKSIDSKICEWIVDSLLPVSLLDNKKFKSIFNEPIMSADTAQRKINSKFLDKKIQIKILFKNIDSKISFSTDIWTGINQKSYIGITAHIINQDYVYYTVLIALKEIISHTGKRIAEIFYEVLCDFEIENKVGFVCTDNASNNDTFIKELGNLLKKKNFKEIHVRCFCHVINLVVQTFFRNDIALEETEVTVPQKKKRKSHDHRESEFVFYQINLFS